jgi:hypothetical protein
VSQNDPVVVQIVPFRYFKSSNRYVGSSNRYVGSSNRYVGSSKGETRNYPDMSRQVQSFLNALGGILRKGEMIVPELAVLRHDLDGGFASAGETDMRIMNKSF